MGYEIDFLSVGNSNGDAICIRYGTHHSNYRIHVVDGGYTDTGELINQHIDKHFGKPRYIENVVLSHADNDHVSGLLDVVRNFNVGTLWMNRPWLYSHEIVNDFHGNYTADGLTRSIRQAYPLLAELESIAVAKGIPVREVFSNTQIGSFTVLAPSRDRYLKLIPQFDRTPLSYAKPVKGVLAKLFEAAKSLNYYRETWEREELQENPAPTSASNESCVVQLGIFDGDTVLLTADAGPIALNEAADFADTIGLLFPPNFIQIPHHGSRRNVTPSVLNRWLGAPLPIGSTIRRGTAFCSVGINKPEYPRHRVANAFLRRGYHVFKSEGDWIRHWNDMPVRPNMIAINPLRFSTAYEE